MCVYTYLHMCNSVRETGAEKLLRHLRPNTMAEPVKNAVKAAAWRCSMQNGENTWDILGLIRTPIFPGF